MKNKITIFDNEGKTWDRFTVIIGEDVFTMSENATSPQGFNQWAGKVWDFSGMADNAFNTVKGYMDGHGKKIGVDSLPLEVKQGILIRLGEDTNNLELLNTKGGIK